MSIQRIKGDDGVIIDSTTFLELPKSPTAAGTGAVRPGMIRYNIELNAFEGVISSDVGNNYRRFPNLDSNGKLLITQLPEGVASGMVYKGTFNPVLDDIDPPSVSGVYTALPEATVDTAGQYWIVRGLMNYAQIHYNANTPTTSPVVFTPANPNGGSQWLEVKYYFNKSGILGAFGRISIASLDEIEHPGFSTLLDDDNLTKFGTKIGNELAFTDGDWVVSSELKFSRIRETRVSILASAVVMSSTLMVKSGRVLAGSDAGTVQTYVDGLVLNALRRGGDSMVADGSAANGRLACVYGTAAAPALTFNNTVFDPDNASGMNPALWSDASTGLFHPAVGVVGISSSGTERFRVTPSASILYQANGINTSSSAALQLSHSTNTSVAGLTAVNNIMYLTVAGAAQAEVSTTGLKVVGTITSAGGTMTGNVVIGTSGGNNTLIVHSASTFNSTALFNGNVTIGDASTDTLTIASTSSFAAPVTFAAPVAMNGNVTIGDASTDTLTVTSTSTFVSPVIMNGNVTLGDAPADAILFNGTSTFAATAPVTMNGNLTVKGNTTIGDAVGDTLTVVSTATFSNPVIFNGNMTVGDAAADTLTVTSTSTFASPVTFNGNVTIGDAVTDTLNITSTATFTNPVIMNGNVTIGDAVGDTLNVTSTATFVNPVSMNGNVNIGDAALDVIAIKGTTNVTAPLTLTNTTLTLAGTTSAVLSKVATGVQITLPAVTEELLLKGSTTTIASVGNYGVLLPVLDSTTATVKVGAVAYDSTKAAVVAGIGAAWVDISTKGGSTAAFTATWTADAANSEIYAEITVAGAKDATAYEDKGTYFQKRSDVTIRVFADKVRVVMPTAGPAFAGRVYINK